MKVEKEIIPLKWIKNNLEGSKFAFGSHGCPELTYLGAPINADFELSFEALAPYVTQVLDQAAPLEGAGITIKLVEIKNGVVKVW